MSINIQKTAADYWIFPLIVICFVTFVILFSMSIEDSKYNTPYGHYMVYYDNEEKLYHSFCSMIPIPYQHSIAFSSRVLIWYTPLYTSEEYDACLLK